MFPGCDCLRQVLCKCGFDNILSLKCVDGNKLEEIESYIEKNRSMTINFFFKCSHKEVYTKMMKFEFLPGHKAVILKWCSELQPYKPSNEFDVDHPAFTPMLKEIITSALSNYKKAANARRYTRLIINFCTYIHILAGKASYEVLCENLLLPKSDTICKFIH